MSDYSVNPQIQLPGPDGELRRVVLLLFCDPMPDGWAALRASKPAVWSRLLRWLDTSGLALYFLDRLKQLDLCSQLPAPVVARLLQNHADNTQRTNELIAESGELQQRFKEANVSYALLKGFSLWPESVYDISLRSQLDLDFLIASESATAARQALECHGYRLHAISGRSWEFKSIDGLPGSLADIYKAGRTRSVELHIESPPMDATGFSTLLASSQIRTIHGIETPVLAPVDLFLGQGLHLYKHLCSEFVRTAHILEFRNHICARRKDQLFWQALRQRSQHDPSARIKLGVVVLLISRVLDDCAPPCLTSWTVDILPANAARWVNLYAHRIALTTFPGTKLYLMLQQELDEIGVSGKRSLSPSLLPRRLPPAITHAAVDESTYQGLRRHLRQMHFILFRLHFHMVQGIAFLCESIRWRAIRNGLA